ncbi:hypothetical protein Glove_40g73 [Diversispora epigaea]|uniref:Uncharacterized protein n=1 Tax=Diversispora epigaea TaxID=1348612 RepID=A0A397JPL1_9GLOM|nr:hypothetical protein Glove_40g73 [Diversispora epigaea]
MCFGLKVDKLGKKFRTDLILQAVKQMNVDDPALIMQWNDNGFNDTRIANCRNGIPRQTKQAIINFIVNNGGVDFREVVWQLARFNIHFHYANTADVCHSIYRTSKLQANGLIDYELFYYPFKQSK